MWIANIIFHHPAGVFGDASARVYLPISAEGEASGSAGGGEEASGCLQQRQRRAVQPATRATQAAKTYRYPTPKKNRHS